MTFKPIPVQISLLIAMLLLVLGYRLGLYSHQPFFQLLLLLQLALFLIALIAVAVAIALRFRQAPQPFPAAKILSVTALGLVPITVVLASVGRAGFDVPPIHDITTDWVNPPEFVAAKDVRGPDDNSLNYAGAEVSRQQRQAYPEVKPLMLEADADAVFVAVTELVNELGWSVLRSDAVAGEIEAVDQTLILGFKDDVIVRVSVIEEGSQVDMRSVSRVGRSDLGANSKRIQQFMSLLENRSFE